MGQFDFLGFPVFGKQQAEDWKRDILTLQPDAFAASGCRDSNYHTESAPTPIDGCCLRLSTVFRVLTHLKRVPAAKSRSKCAYIWIFVFSREKQNGNPNWRRG
jgi:hypothetical protein